MRLMLLALLLAGCTPAPNKPVCVVTFIGLMETFPLDLAQDLGFFRVEGVEVNIEHVSKLTEAVLSGSCDMVYDGYSSTLQADAAGAALKTTFVVNVRPTLLVLVNPQKAAQIQKVEDLKGALLGITAFGTGTEALARHMMRAHGLGRDDVTLVPVGSGPRAVAALENGKVDAAFFSTSGYLTVKQRVPGVHVLVDPRTAEGTKQFYGTDAIAGFALSAKQDWLVQHPEQTRRVERALVRVLQWVHGHSLEEVYARVKPEYFSGNKETDMEALRTFVNALSVDGRMPVGASAAMQRVTGAADERVMKLDLSTTYTNEFLEKQ